MAHEFRFGVSLRAAQSQQSVQQVACRAEELGFDVLHVPDHLGAPAPFPVLTTAATATTTLKVGTFVLNACFYKPALLARDVAALRDISGGRFEVGLGAGYVREEFEAAELPFPTARRRVEYMEHVTDYIAEHLPDVPIMIAGNGDRLLTVAAEHAGIVGFTGGGPPVGDVDPLLERIEFLRTTAGDRFDEIELNIAITAMPDDDSGVPDLSTTRRFMPDVSDEVLLRHPGVLSGSTRDIADQLRARRDRYGLTYIIVQYAHLEAFGKVIAELR